MKNSYRFTCFALTRGSPERHTKKRVSKCSKLVKQYVAMQNITKASGILDFDTVAFSNFYRTALDADLIGTFYRLYDTNYLIV